MNELFKLGSITEETHGDATTSFTEPGSTACTHDGSLGRPGCEA